MTTIELFRSPTRGFSEPAPPDAAMVNATSRLVLLSGVQSDDQDGAVVGEGDVAEQVRGAMRNIELILGDLGGSLSDIAKAVIYVKSSEVQDMDSAWGAFLDVLGDHHPAATIIGVTLLGGGPAWLVEIEATATLP